MASVNADRQQFGISVLGGPTTVVDYGGWRFVIDPTFDDPGEYGYLTKLSGPAVGASDLGPVDVVLVSHDEHFDNFDREGRQFALNAPLIITHPGGAARLGPPAQGLAEWQTFVVDGVDGRPPIVVRAVPAVHGPADGDRDSGGHVNVETTGFVLTGDGLPTVYLSGDNASLRAVADIALRCGPIDVAVLFIGAARVPVRQNGRPLTLTSCRAAAAAEVLGAKVVIPAHTDGWAHFTEGTDAVQRAFFDAGIASILAVAPLGEWIIPAAAEAG